MIDVLFMLVKVIELRPLDCFAASVREPATFWPPPAKRKRLLSGSALVERLVGGGIEDTLSTIRSLHFLWFLLSCTRD